MALVSQKVTNIFGGVSQQPPEQRSSSQADEQINIYSVFGRAVMRRPPLVYIAKLLSTADTAATVIPVSTRDGNKFFAVISAGAIRVFDAVTGAEKTVSNLAGFSYLTTAPQGYRWASAGDSTFIANRSTAVKSGTSKSAAVVREALVWVRQGDYDTKYTIALNGVEYSYTTPTTTAVGARLAIATDAIAASLMVLLPATFTGTRYGSTIYLVPVNGADFTLKSSDGLADQGLVAIKGRVQRFTDLPPKCRANVIVEVTGDDSSKFDNYYVQYDDSASPGELGVWKEVVQPDLVLGFDASTMPHQLVWRGNYVEETLASGPYTDPPAAYNVAANQGTVTLNPYLRYPAGVTITIAVAAGPTWTYTPLTDVTAAAIVGQFVTQIAGTAGWVASAFPPGSVLVFGKTPAAAFTYTATLTGWDSSTQFYAPKLNPDSTLVGKVVNNLTDGSTGVITAVNVLGNSLRVAALTGGADNRFDPGDKCVVVNTGDYFTFSRPVWNSRVAGNDTTAPLPSFVGQTLSDIFVHKNRLGFTAKDAVILSRPGDLFNFFRQTATQLLDDDLIDVKSALPGAPDFHAALDWNEGLYLFTEKTQLELVGDPILTPRTVELKVASTYENTKNVRPCVAGKRIFFAGLKNGYPRIQDYHTLGSDRTLVVGEDISEHVSKYLLNSNPCAIAADDTESVVFLQFSQKFFLNVYSYAFDEDARVQSAWCRWEFPKTLTVLSIAVSNGMLAVAASGTNDGIALYSIDLDPVRLAAALRYNASCVYDGAQTYTSPTT